MSASSRPAFTDSSARAGALGRALAAVQTHNPAGLGAAVTGMRTARTQRATIASIRKAVVEAADLAIEETKYADKIAAIEDPPVKLWYEEMDREQLQQFWKNHKDYRRDCTDRNLKPVKGGHSTKRLLAGEEHFCDPDEWYPTDNSIKTKLKKNAKTEFEVNSYFGRIKGFPLAKGFKELRTWTPVSVVTTHIVQRDWTKVKDDFVEDTLFDTPSRPSPSVIDAAMFAVYVKEYLDAYKAYDNAKYEAKEAKAEARKKGLPNPPVTLPPKPPVLTHTLVNTWQKMAFRIAGRIFMDKVAVTDKYRGPAYDGNDPLGTFQEKAEQSFESKKLWFLNINIRPHANNTVWARMLGKGMELIADVCLMDMNRGRGLRETYDGPGVSEEELQQLRAASPAHKLDMRGRTFDPSRKEHLADHEDIWPYLLKMVTVIEAAVLSIPAAVGNKTADLRRAFKHIMSLRLLKTTSRLNPFTVYTDPKTGRGQLLLSVYFAKKLNLRRTLWTHRDPNVLHEACLHAIDTYSQALGASPEGEIAAILTALREVATVREEFLRTRGEILDEVFPDEECHDDDPKACAHACPVCYTMVPGEELVHPRGPRPGVCCTQCAKEFVKRRQHAFWSSSLAKEDFEGYDRRACEQHAQSVVKKDAWLGDLLGKVTL